MLQRLRKLWKLSKKDTKALEELTPEQVEQIPDAGDGKAVFFSEGSEEEFEEQKKADSGLLAWYNRIRNL